LAAALAGPMLDRAVVLPVRLAHRVFGVVTDLERGLVDLRVAPVAEPEEPVALAQAPAALGDEREGPRWKPRRVRDTGRAVHVLALPQHPDLLLALRREIVQPHLAAELQHGLRRRVHVELAPVRAPVGDERQRLALLPQNRDLPPLVHDRVQVGKPTVVHAQASALAKRSRWCSASPNVWASIVRRRKVWLTFSSSVMPMPP